VFPTLTGHLATAALSAFPVVAAVLRVHPTTPHARGAPAATARHGAATHLHHLHHHAAALAAGTTLVVVAAATAAALRSGLQGGQACEPSPITRPPVAHTHAVRCRALAAHRRRGGGSGGGSGGRCAARRRRTGDGGGRRRGGGHLRIVWCAMSATCMHVQDRGRRDDR
jgi:uncharacterized membrane protein YgcG